VYVTARTSLAATARTAARASLAITPRLIGSP
jgi:hypothetical protein